MRPVVFEGRKDFVEAIEAMLPNDVLQWHFPKEITSVYLQRLVYNTVSCLPDARYSTVMGEDRIFIIRTK